MKMYTNVHKLGEEKKFERNPNVLYFSFLDKMFLCFCSQRRRREGKIKQRTLNFSRKIAITAQKKNCFDENTKHGEKKKCEHIRRRKNCYVLLPKLKPIRTYIMLYNNNHHILYRKTPPTTEPNFHHPFQKDIQNHIHPLTPRSLFINIIHIFCYLRPRDSTYVFGIYVGPCRVFWKRSFFFYFKHIHLLSLLFLTIPHQTGKYGSTGRNESIDQPNNRTTFITYL